MAEPDTIPTDADEAELLGWQVDASSYPWTAYRGDLDRPERVVEIATPAWHPAAGTPPPSRT